MKNIFIALLLVSSLAFAETDKLGSSKSAEIGFEKGMASLTDSDKESIKKTVEDAKAMGTIKEVKVVSWADREYPADGEKASKESVKLAEARADSLKRYLKDLKVSSVKTYNMASRPNALQETFHTSQAKVKDQLEKSGAAPTSSQDTGFMGLNAKTSAGLVLIYTKGNPNKY